MMHRSMVWPKCGHCAHEFSL